MRGRPGRLEDDLERDDVLAAGGDLGEGAVEVGQGLDQGAGALEAVLQGVGGGGIMTINLVVITDLVPLSRRSQWYGITNAMWSIGSVTGPILGGGFAGIGSWVRISHPLQ